MAQPDLATPAPRPHGEPMAGMSVRRLGVAMLAVALLGTTGCQRVTIDPAAPAAASSPETSMTLHPPHPVASGASHAGMGCTLPDPDKCTGPVPVPNGGGASSGH